MTPSRIVVAIPVRDEAALSATACARSRCNRGSVRHGPDVCVTVSGRTLGRAADGMADTIRRRMVRQDPMLDAALEPVADRIRRIVIRRLLRSAWAPDARPGAAADLAARLEVSQNEVESWLGLPHFGAAWVLAEAASPSLASQPVERAAVQAQLSAALDMLRQLESLPGPQLADPAVALLPALGGPGHDSQAGLYPVPACEGGGRTP